MRTYSQNGPLAGFIDKDEHPSRKLPQTENMKTL